MKEVPWYENPGAADGTWTKHVMVTGVNAPINAAVYDTDADGIPEVALAADFATVYGKSAGTLYLLSHKGDPTGPWDMKEIDRAPTAHRVRWVDVDGKGKVLVNAPLIGANSIAPDYKDKVGIFYYRGPDWKRQSVTDADSGVIHGLWVMPWNNSKFEALLSASFNGVFAHQFQNGSWTRTKVVDGDPGALAAERHQRHRTWPRRQGRALPGRHRAVARQQGGRLPAERQRLGASGDRRDHHRRPHADDR